MIFIWKHFLKKMEILQVINKIITHIREFRKKNFFQCILYPFLIKIQKNASYKSCSSSDFLQLLYETFFFFLIFEEL